MSDKNQEMMKKLIEEKKQKRGEEVLRPEHKMGNIQKGNYKNQKKTGGFFDK